MIRNVAHIKTPFTMVLMIFNDTLLLLQGRDRQRTGVRGGTPELPRRRRRSLRDGSKTDETSQKHRILRQG